MAISVVVLGAGKIGQAVFELIPQIINGISSSKLSVKLPKLHLWDNLLLSKVTKVVDFTNCNLNQICILLKQVKATHVVNCLPFFLNEKVASASVMSECSYIDFTEDDIQADIVQAIYAAHPTLYCAVKCGLAPGYINYIGHSLVSNIYQPDHLMISVGALPRNVNGTDPQDLYNLSWSVDGLVNEYIRLCRVRVDGHERMYVALTQQELVIADGIQYEAALTSGGVGSLLTDLPHVPNIAYKTLRYPGHYSYAQDIVAKHNGDFESIKAEFLSTFPYNDDDVIVVYAEAKGRNEQGNRVRKTFSRRYVGHGGLSGIQCTTAGAGVAMLEMMLIGTVKSGIIKHKDVSLEQFCQTRAVKQAYREA